MNDKTRQGIKKAISRVLKDAGVNEPPVRIEGILGCLELHRDFYDLDDPSLI